MDHPTLLQSAVKNYSAVSRAFLLALSGQWKSKLWPGPRQTFVVAPPAQPKAFKLGNLVNQVIRIIGIPWMYIHKHVFWSFYFSSTPVEPSYILIGHSPGYLSQIPVDQTNIFITSINSVDLQVASFESMVLGILGEIPSWEAAQIQLIANDKNLLQSFQTLKYFNSEQLCLDSVIMATVTAHPAGHQFISCSFG